MRNLQKKLNAIWQPPVSWKKKLQLFLTPFSSKIEGKAKMISHGLAIACGLINNKVYPAKNMLCNL